MTNCSVQYCDEHMAVVQHGSWHSTEIIALQASMSEHVQRLTMLVGTKGNTMGYR